MVWYGVIFIDLFFVFVFFPAGFGHSHVAAPTNGSPDQNFRRLPFPQLHILQRSPWTGPRPAIGWAQTPQFGCQVCTNQNAASRHIAMDTALTVQVVLEGEEEKNEV